MGVDHDQPTLSHRLADRKERGPEYSEVRNICLLQNRKNGVQGEVSENWTKRKKEWNTIKRLQNPGSNGAAYGEFSFSYIFGVFLSFFSGRGRPAGRAEKVGSFFILVNFSLGIITLLLSTYPRD